MFSMHQCLLAMLEKRQKSDHNGKAFGALLTDLSKVFDCRNHELLITKLNTYGFSLPRGGEIASFAVRKNNVDGVVKSLEEASTNLFK